MIPRDIHFVWSGNAELPDYALDNMDAWERLNKGFTTYFWNDKNRPELSAPLSRAYELARNSGERSDIVRHDLLWRYGGYSIDLDIFPVRPLSRIKEVRQGTADAILLSDGSRFVGSQERGALIGAVIEGLLPAIEAALVRQLDVRTSVTGHALISHCLTLPGMTQARTINGDLFPDRDVPGMIGLHSWEGHWLKQLDERFNKK